MKTICITNDVEATTIFGEAYNQDIAKRVCLEAIPKVLSIYKEYRVKATFFCQGTLIQQYPEIVRMIEANGHEVACHGLVHASNQAFDVLSLEQQIEHLHKAKNIIENVSKNAIVSFRAPALRVDFNTPKALMSTGFTHDSSVASQRLDAFMSLGSKKKLQWIMAPRNVYQTSINNLAVSGDSTITEVPVSAFGLPYISTLMRISSFFTSITRKLLYLETRKNNNKVVTFLFHPGEILENQCDNQKVIKRTNNPISYLFSGLIRTSLKKKNLGDKCIPLLEKELQYWISKGYEFKTIKEV